MQTNSNWCCSICGVCSNKTQELRAHCLETHPNKLELKYECPICHLYLPSRRKLNKHRAQEHPGMHKAPTWKPGGNCKFCGTPYGRLASLRLHESHCFLNPNRTEIKSHPQTIETRLKIKATARKEHRMGGHRIGSGRGKKGWYKGYFCDSSWELAFVIYNIDHDIEFYRNTETFDYEFNGETHKYLPDFIIDDEYYEIKGYITKQWEAKLSQFPSDKKLLVIDEQKIKPYLDYVIANYGKEYVSLYEKTRTRNTK